MRLMTNLLLLIPLLHSSGLCAETLAPDAPRHARAFLSLRSPGSNEQVAEKKTGKSLWDSIKAGFDKGLEVGTTPAMVIADTIDGKDRPAYMGTDPGAAVVLAFGFITLGLPLGAVGAVCGGVAAAAGNVVLTVNEGKKEIQGKLVKHKFKEDLKKSIGELKGSNGKIAISNGLFTGKKPKGKSIQETVDADLPCLQDGKYECDEEPIAGDVPRSYKYTYKGRARACKPEDFRCFDKETMYQLLGLDDKCTLKSGKQTT